MNDRRILSIDIETFPLEGMAWETYQTNILRVTKPTVICCFSAKWLNGKQITKALPDYKGYKVGSRDDRPILEDIWDLLNEADAAIAHNGDGFDFKVINSRFTYHQMKPPAPYKTVDTLKQARRIAKYSSNRLNDLGQYLELGEKLHTGGFSLWEGCLAGDKQSWKHMKQYNAQDVVLLEKLYLRLLPWISNHPSLAVGYGPGVCPQCQGTSLQRRGFSFNKGTAYQRYQCSTCGKWLRDTENLIEPENRPFIAL